jgi:lipopolysaccharide export system protein LptA/phage anti-repressor protein
MIKSLLSLLFIIMTLTCLSQGVQMDTLGLKMINITGDSLRGYKSETESYQRIIGAVVITHEGTTMTCDSAHFYTEANIVEAYSNVNILRSNGTNAHGDYMKYTGHNRTAFMKGNVQIIDGANTLFTAQLTYNLKTKIGKYYDGGTLQTEETTVSSNEGMYNGFTKQSYFKTEVIITNPKYTIESKELTYNTNTKVIKFLDKSTIIGENTTVYTSAGIYDSKAEKASFSKRTTIENEDQIITGNTLSYNDITGFGKAVGDVIIIDVKNNSKITSRIAEYNKITGYGKATGDVVIEKDDGKSILTAYETEYNKKSGYIKASGDVVFIDTTEKSKLICGVAEFNDNSKFMLATVNPKLITFADNDSTFMRADTMMTLRVKDKDKLERIVMTKGGKEKNVKMYSYNLLYADSTYRSEDSAEPKLILANHNVKIFSDSMQAVCDSLSYSQLDSIFKLYRSPVMWSKKQQSFADTIFIQTKNNKLSEVNLKNAAFLISETGYKTMYDQVSGNYIDAYFTNNEIDFIKVDQNAESLYYAKDDAEAYIGLNKAESSKMNVYFRKGIRSHRDA